MRIKRDTITLFKIMGILSVMALGAIFAVAWALENVPQHHCGCD